MLATVSMIFRCDGFALASSGARATSLSSTSSCLRRPRSSTAVLGGTARLSQPSTVTNDSRCRTDTSPLLQNITMATGLTALLSCSVGGCRRCCSSLCPPVLRFSKKVRYRLVVAGRP